MKSSIISKKPSPHLLAAYQVPLKEPSTNLDTFVPAICELSVVKSATSRPNVKLGELTPPRKTCGASSGLPSEPLKPERTVIVSEIVTAVFAVD